MADRLAELLRQRALLQEHLAWLDREIAAASERSQIPTSPAPAAYSQPVAPIRPATPLAATGHSVAASGSPATPSTTTSAVAAAILSHAGPAATPTPPADPVVEAAANEIIEQYRVAPDSLKTDVRTGCFLYFAAALALVIATVAILYTAFRK